MGIISSYWGKNHRGENVNFFEISHENGLRAVFTDLGARIHSIIVPDKNGNLVDVVLGYDDVLAYDPDDAYMGATIGQVANRLAGEVYELAGESYLPSLNENGQKALHGGFFALDQQLFKTEILNDHSLKFSFFAEDGILNFKGERTFSVVYTFTDTGILTIDYDVQSNVLTPVNLTNHVYFNLNGAGMGSILDHSCQIQADFYTPTDEFMLATGEVKQVTGTPLDFRVAKTFKQDFDLTHPVLKNPRGYDHNFVLKKTLDQNYLQAAKVIGDKTGICLELITDQPALQLYTANFLSKRQGKNNQIYQECEGFCLEAQGYPNALKQLHFPSILIDSNKPYKKTITFKFSTLL